MTQVIPRRRFLKSAAVASIGLPATTSIALGASTAHAKAPTEEDGFMIHPHTNSAMTGIPPKEHDLVTIDSAPTSRDKHRWALCHTRELMPTQCISRGTDEVAELARDRMPVREFNEMKVKSLKGKSVTIGELFDQQHTDAFLCMVDGKIVSEQYFGGMTPDKPHDLYSTGKSLSSTLIGTMLGNVLDKDAAIEAYLPEFAESKLKGATIQQMLDMQSGSDYSYGLVEDTTIAKHIALTRATPEEQEPKSQWQMLLDAPKVRPHGEVMQYKEYDVISVVLAAERKTETRFADLFSQSIWSQLGMEHDAYVRCDGWGLAVPSFGICATLRDMGRWCQMVVNGGNFNGRQVVPATYLEEVRNGDQQPVPLKGCISGYECDQPPGTMYHNWFWFPGLISDAYATSGGLGQFCYMNWRHRTVIVAFSCWMAGDDFQRLDHTYWHAFQQITEKLNA
jgi:CubicO group peptidase (beta-lactamase class C family)